MLNDKKAYSSFSVNDIDAAFDFYTTTLGLQVKRDEMDILVLMIPGNDNGTLIYPKRDHVPATFTILNFPVDDLDATVDWLTQKGVAFEQYDMPDLKTDAKGIARGDEGPEMAWFKDPAGNIIGLQGKY